MKPSTEYLYALLASIALEAAGKPPSDAIQKRCSEAFLRMVHAYGSSRAYDAASAIVRYHLRCFRSS